MIGAEPHHGQRQADLVVLVALVLQRHELRARTVAIASFVEVLAMLPVTPTTSGSNRVAPGGRDRAGSRGSVSATSMTVTSAAPRSSVEPIEPVERPRDEDRGRATRDGVGDEGVTVGPLARQGHEQVAGHRPRGSRRRRPAPSRANERARSAARGARPGRRWSARDRRRHRPGGGCDAGSVTDSSVAYEVVTGRRPCGRDRQSGAPAAAPGG